jgi:hypothetical protein
MVYLKSLLLSFFVLSVFDTQVYAAKSEKKQELYHWPVQQGEDISWKVVDELLPTGSKFQVIDVDTGLTFSVQRRAGGAHADVQPLTRSDTNIMKLIYRGRWSWERNDIVIKVKDRYIAASMNGMPHGYGALQNGFPGHFCIHFKGSTTHKRHNVDLAHHLMIAKAAAKLDDFTSQLSAVEVIQAYEIGINHQEPAILHQILESNERKQLDTFQYMSLNLSERGQKTDTLLTTKFHATARVQEVNSHKIRRLDITFQLVRESVLDKWQISEIVY